MDQNKANRSKTHGSEVDFKSYLPVSRKDSVIVRVKSARQLSNGPVNFAKHVCILLVTTICFTLFLGFFMIVPLSKLVIGGFYFKECPAQPLIPVYLVVSGAITCSRDIVGVVMRCILEEERYYHYHKKISFLLVLISLAELVIFIGGTVLVFTTHPQWNDKESRANYCEVVLYWFTYWIIIASWILMGMVLSAIIMSMCLFYCLSSGSAVEEKERREIIIIPKLVETTSAEAQMDAVESGRGQYPNTTATAEETAPTTTAKAEPV